MKIFISFDFDRTLADLSRAHGNAILAGIHETFEKKFQVNWFDLSCSGLTDLQIITNLVHNHGLSYHTIFKNMNLCLFNIVENFNRYKDIYPVELLAHAKDTIEELFYNENVILGLSTGNIKPISIKKVQTTGIDEYFSFGSFGNEVFNRYQLLEVAKNRLINNFGFSKDDIAIHIGDAVLDVLSAKKAGFIPIGVATGSYTKEQLLNAGAKFVLEDISDINEYLGEITHSIQKKQYTKALLIK